VDDAGRVSDEQGAVHTDAGAFAADAADREHLPEQRVVLPELGEK
jgi:hypothetical protein